MVCVMVVFGWRRVVDFLTNRPVMALLWTLRVPARLFLILASPPLCSKLLLSSQKSYSLALT